MEFGKEESWSQCEGYLQSWILMFNVELKSLFQTNEIHQVQYKLLFVVSGSIYIEYPYILKGKFTIDIT